MTGLLSPKSSVCPILFFCNFAMLLEYLGQAMELFIEWLLGFSLIFVFRAWCRAPDVKGIGK